MALTFVFRTIPSGQNITIIVNEIYLFKIDLLKKFILYFKDKALPIIKKAEGSKIIIPDLLSSKEMMEEKSMKENLNSSIRLDKILLRICGQDVSVNINEAKILAYMKKGLTAKQIAKELQLKPKTIEIYRSNITRRIFETVSYEDILLELHKNPLIDIEILNQ